MNTSDSAPSDAASAADAVSAFTFNSPPFGPSAIEETHRHDPAAQHGPDQHPVRADHPADVPRSMPSIGSCLSATSVDASDPLMPAARRCIAASSLTIILFTLPARTETTTSSVASSVMRSPACVRFGIPSEASFASTCLPRVHEHDRLAALPLPGDGGQRRFAPGLSSRRLPPSLIPSR